MIVTHPISNCGFSCRRLPPREFEGMLRAMAAAQGAQQEAALAGVDGDLAEAFGVIDTDGR